MKSWQKLTMLLLIVILLLILIPYFFIPYLSHFCEPQLNVLYVYFTFLIMLTALFGREFWNWYHRPEIQLQFEEDYPFIIETNNAIWVRVMACNNGNTTAKECEARLEKIFDVIEEEKEIKKEFEKLILPWVGYPYAVKRISPESIYFDITAKEWTKIDIAKSMEALFDICYINKYSKEINLVTSVEWPRFVKWIRNEKKLRFLVSVYGENFKSKSKKDIVIDIEQILNKFTNPA